MKYSDEELIALVEREENQSYSTNSGKLKEERDEALDYYLGEPFGNEVKDRSQVVTRDVLDTIEWVLPSLLKVFTSGDEVVKFNPREKNDIENAEQETEYINYVVNQKNPGFQLFYTWFKDALLQKSGYVKVWWEVKEETQDERYEGLTEDELAFILQDKEVEITEQEQYVNEWGMPLYTVKLRKIVPLKQVRITNVPPEEMLVSTRTRAVHLTDSPFVEHRCYKTISDLRAEGYKLDMSKMQDYDYEDNDRDIYDESGYFQESETEEAMRAVMVRDCYMRIDLDGDGIAELARVLIAGTQVLEKEPVDFIPFASICPVPMPHRHIGLSYADLVMDLQLIKSTVTRQILDNIYLSNNTRMAVDPARVNLDDLLVSRPGGIVRTKGDPSGAIQPLINPPMFGQSFNLLEYIDGMRENRTGITKYNQGLDANSLNKTATGISAIMGAAQQRIELVARLFAETGVKEMFQMVHALVRKYSDNVEMVKLRNDYVPVDPRGWRKRTDLTISVGLGTGNKDQMMQHLMLILQAQREALQIGIATPKNVHYALTKLTQNAGFKDADSFWTDPEAEGLPQQGNPEQEQMVKEQMQQMHEEIQKLGQEKQKLEAEILKRDTDTSVKVYEIDTRSNTELKKVEMTNENKTALASMQAITDAILQTQQQLETRIGEVAESEPDLTPVIAQIEDIQNTITNSVPVSIKQIRDENGKLIGVVRILADGTEQEIMIK